MATLGSSAYSLEMYAEEQHASSRYELSVMQGGGRETRARRDASPQSVSLARIAVVFVVLFALLGGVRVTLSVMTVQCLSDVSQTSRSIGAAQQDKVQLQADRSELLAADRIQNIATQDYGMSFATSVDRITVRDEFLPQASADAEQSANGTDGAGGDA